SCDNNDGLAAACFVEVLLQKLAHFTTAFADQRDDVDVGLGVAGDHAQERGFAHAAACEDAEALAAAAGDESVHGLDAGAEGIADALALERVRRQKIQTDRVVGLNRPEVIQRLAQSIDHTALEAFADRDTKRGAERDDFAAGMDTAQFTQRREEDVVIAEADHLGERGAIVAGGFNAADFPDGGERTLGFNDEPDKLDHAAVVANDLGALDPAQKGFHPAALDMVRAWHHATRLLRRRSNLVSRRASTVPNWVCTRQPPRVTSGEPRKRNSWEPSVLTRIGEFAFCSSSRSAGWRRTVNLAVPSTWASASRTAASTMGTEMGMSATSFWATSSARDTIRFSVSRITCGTESRRETSTPLRSA